MTSRIAPTPTNQEKITIMNHTPSRRLIVSILGAALIAITGVALYLSFTGTSSAPSRALANTRDLRSTPAHPGEPPLATISRLRVAQHDRAAFLTLAPPAGSYEPTVSAQHAEDIAWGTHGPSGHPERASAILALTTSSQSRTPTAAWLITFSEGTCTPTLGGPGKTARCIKQPWRTVVNAKTGRVMFEYADQSVTG